MTAADLSLVAAHRETVRAFAKPGEALAADSSNATTRNPRWFRQGSVGPQPRYARDQLHGRLIAEYLAARPDIRYERRAIVLAGPPGAGKSTVLQEVLGGVSEAWLTVDADEFKRALLQAAIDDGTYEGIIKPAAIHEREAAGEKFYPLELASLVHEESSMLAKRLRRQVIAEGMNVVVDTVLSSEDAAQRLGRDLSAAGYEVEVIDVEVPYELSVQRIADRWQRSYEAALSAGEGLGGRWVPSEYAREVYDGPDGRSRPEVAAERLAQMSPDVLRYRRFRTSHEGAQRVSEVDKVRISRGSALVDHDVAQMLARSTAGLASPRRSAKRGTNGSERGTLGR